MEEEDRISQLPDPILLQIISLIDINQAVQTTILSSRWKNLCFSLSDLHFHLARGGGGNLDNRPPSEAFSHFVSCFLSHRDGATTIRNFHLSLDSRGADADADAAFIEKCAQHAVNHGVISLLLRFDGFCRLPLRLPAASQTLRELKLTQFSDGVYLPKRSSLPNLKTLHLERSLFVDDDRFNMTEEPFSGFPELEELSLRRCGRLNGLVISAPKLRFLEIVEEKMTCAAMKEISAPRLTSFRYEGSLPLECSKINLPMLEEVYLSIYRNKGYYIYRPNENMMPLKCVRMFQQLGNAKTVTLTLDTLKVLEMDRGLILQSPSPFPYMKSLILRKGRREIQTVLKRVMNYLTKGSLYSDLMAEFPEGVSVVEMNSDDLFDEDNDELQLHQLLFD